jgi:hypothetical protein
VSPLVGVGHAITLAAATSVAARAQPPQVVDELASRAARTEPECRAGQWL